MITVVTDEHSFTAMIGKRDVAVWTLNRFPARPAEHKTGIAPAIEQDDRLLSLFLRLANGLEEFIRKDLGLTFSGKDLAHVDDAGGSHGPRADSFR